MMMMTDYNDADITCAHCGRPIEDDDGTWFHPDTLHARCDGPDDEDGIGWGDLVMAEPMRVCSRHALLAPCSGMTGCSWEDEVPLPVWDAHIAWEMGRPYGSCGDVPDDDPLEEVSR